MLRRRRTNRSFGENLLIFLGVIVALGVVMGLEYLMPAKTYILTCMILAPVLLIIDVWIFKKSKSLREEQTSAKKIAVLGYFSAMVTMVAFLLITTLFSMDRYYYDGGEDLVFWQYSLILAVAVALLSVCVINFRKLFTLHSAALFCVIVVLGFFISNCYMRHINYVADSGKPVTYSSVIFDKEKVSRRKARDVYRFVLNAEGQVIKLEVPSEDYYYFDERDEFTFFRYYGAFGKGFFVR